MKNNQSTLRVLLDTSFILPTLGIDVGKEVLVGLEKLSEIRAEIYYSRFSILEALWIAARLAKNKVLDVERFEQGLRSILESNRYVEVPVKAEVFSEALRLWVMGHKDIIDNILYATTIVFDLKLLTLDAELREFIHDKGLRDTLITPKDLNTVINH